MARIPEHIVDQIYQVVDIVEIVSDYVSLKKKGANYWGLSPFTNEKTPSFSVHAGKGIYKDFSSGKGGNAINFLMEMEGLSYIEALRSLAKRYNIELEEEEDTQEVKEARDRRQSLFIVNDFAARYFHRQLTETSEGQQIGLSYFKERGILGATIEAFQLGYAPDEWEAFAKEAQAKQYNPEYLIELGLASKSDKTDKLIDRFRGRVMFPICNPMGKVVGFGGRILGNRKDIAKYINSSESEIYHKSQTLYGLHLAKKHIRDQDLCILTEGYMDTIVLHQYGIKHVVASSGTALTTDQVRLIRRYTKQVLMIYDGDEAGIKAASRGIDLLIREEMSAKVLILPDNHDPDSYVRNYGAQAFLDFISKEALDFTDFKMRIMSEGKDVNHPDVQSQLIRGMAETLANIADRVKRQMYIRYVAQQVDITETLMTHAVDEARVSLHKLEARTQKREEAIRATEAPAEVMELKSFEQLELASQEKEILRVMICHFDKTIPEDPEAPQEDDEGNAIPQDEIPLMEYLMDELEGLTFENQTYEKLKNEFFEEFDTHGRIDLNPFLAHPDPAITQLISSLLMQKEISPLWKKIRTDIVYDGNLSKVAEGPIFHYKNRKVRKLIQECKERIKNLPILNYTEEEEENLFVKFKYLKEIQREIQKKLGIEGAVEGRDGQL